MKLLPELFSVVAHRVKPPVLIVLGSPWPVTQLVQKMHPADITCFQMDRYAGDRLQEKLVQESVTAEVIVGPDVWDLPQRFQTVLFPAAAQSDTDLKLDMVEQSFHVLVEGGLFIALSDYERDQQFEKWHKKIFGHFSSSPRSEAGMAFWSTREGEHPRKRHAMNFHAKINDRPSMNFFSWPGTFSYGRMDNGSRAMLEVADIEEGARVLDLGCGNGSVGCLASQQAGKTGHITFIDSNARATALTKLNAVENQLQNYDVITSGTLQELPKNSFDVILANPPYYANSEVARLFISNARDLLRPGGCFYLVTKMPVQTIPEVVETFGEAESVESRGYTVLMARL
jgi:16S rRNA G1207 methylase RsmC